MWSVWLVFCDCGFHSVFPLKDKDKSLWKLPNGRDWLWGKLGLVLMVRALLSKSLLNKGSGVGRVRKNNGEVRQKQEFLWIHGKFPLVPVLLLQSPLTKSRLCSSALFHVCCSRDSPYMSQIILLGWNWQIYPFTCWWTFRFTRCIF